MSAQRTKTWVFLYLCMLLFNIPTTWGEDSPSRSECHTAVAFGQSRWASPQQKNIRDAADLARWMSYDWSKYRLRTVVLDPGHGGRDLGTTHGKHYEKDIALRIAKRLGASIQAQQPQVRVIYTRDKDRFVSLRARAALANKNKADLFLSIHCNAVRGAASVRGMEAYVMGLEEAAENRKVIQRENDVVTLEPDYKEAYEDYNLKPDSPLYEILLHSYQNAHLEQSLYFASQLEAEQQRQGRPSRGIHQANFLVLRRTAMPSVLVETGYLSNAKDRKWLTSQKGQKALAKSLLNAFLKYKSMVEGRPLAESAPYPAAARDSVFSLCLMVSDSSQNLGHGKWDSLRDSMIVEKDGNGRAQYLWGRFRQREKAEEKAARYRVLGFPDCRVVRIEGF